MERLFKVIVIITVIFCGSCEPLRKSRQHWHLQRRRRWSNAFGEQLNKIKTYDFDKSRADLIKVSDMISDANGKPEMKAMEKQLDDFLKSDATYAAKDFCVQRVERCRDGGVGSCAGFDAVR